MKIINIYKNWGRLVLLTTCAMLLGLFYWAPYLPRLIQEGYPKSTWPASGFFTEITTGNLVKLLKIEGPLSITPNTWLHGLFNKSGGKAFLVYHAGALRLEHYAQGTSGDTRFNSYSLVKSLVGVLVLKALAEKKLENLDTPLGSILADIGNPGLHKISFQNLLDMRSGVSFEPGSMISVSGIREKDIEAVAANPFGPLARLHFLGPDNIIHQLRSSGKKIQPFNYQNVNTALIGMALEKLYDAPLHKILEDKIWRPAGAGTAYWRQYNSTGKITAYCCLYATAMDWVKVTLYIINNGTADNPFLPKPLWRNLFGKNLSLNKSRQGDYSFHVRHNILDRDGEPLQGPFTYFMGQGGQVVYMMPDKNLIVVRFGDKPQLLHSTLYAAWRSISTSK